MTNKKILIIEDEPALRELLRTKLNREGFQTLTAAEGRLGLQQAFDHRPDLILLDVIMPELSGEKVLAELRKDAWGRRVPVIIMTNLLSVSKIVEVLRQIRQSVTALPVLPAIADDHGLQRYLETYPSRQYEIVVKSDMHVADLLQRIRAKLRIAYA